MDINLFSLCLIGLSSDGSPGLQECPKKFFSPPMNSPLVGLWCPILKKICLKKFFRQKKYLKTLTLKVLKSFFLSSLIQTHSTVHPWEINWLLCKWKSCSKWCLYLFWSDCSGMFSGRCFNELLLSPQFTCGNETKSCCLLSNLSKIVET
jgi:hypothetical protein